MDIIEYSEEFDMVLADAIDEAIGCGPRAMLKLGIFYDLHFRVQAAYYGCELGYPVDEAAAMFATYEANRIENTTGTLSTIFSGKSREKLANLQKVKKYSLRICRIFLSINSKYTWANLLS